MKATVGTKVQAYTGRCVGILIESTTWEGEITKVNAKSIRVRLTHATSKFGGETTAEYDMSREITYRFAKTLSNGKDFYTSEGRIYGHIQI